MKKKNKPWHCGSGQHVIGLIRWNGDQVPQLVLYRHAVDPGADAPAEIDVLGPVIGRIPVKCDLCDQVRLWDISTDALVALANYAEGRRLQEFLERMTRRWQKK